MISVYNSNAKRVLTLSATGDTGAGVVIAYDEDGQKMASLSSKDGQGVVWTQK